MEIEKIYPRLRKRTVLDPPVNERFHDNIQDPDPLHRSNDASDPSDNDYMSDRIFQDGDDGDNHNDDDSNMPYLMRRANNDLDDDDDDDTIPDGIAPQDTGPAPRQPHPGGQGRMAIIDTNDIIGRTFLTVPQEDGKMRLRIIEALDQDEQERVSHPANIKFHAVNGDNSYEEIVSYNQIIDHLTDDDGEDGITKHDQPTPTQCYKGRRIQFYTIRRFFISCASLFMYRIYY